MKSKTLKSLISEHDLSFDAATIMNALLKAGYAELFQYPSTTGSGEMKSFKRLTELGTCFGVNKPSMGHPFKTETRFFSESFPTMLQLVVSQLQGEVQALTEQQPAGSPA